MKKRTIGSLTHADFGRRIEVAGHAYGYLWSIQHVAAVGDIPEPWTRVTVRHEGGRSEATKGLPPDTPVVVHDIEEPDSLVCGGCGAVVVGESNDAVRGLAWIHAQDCQGAGVL